MAFKNDPGLLDKIGDDEPIFILRAQDKTAPDCVEDWAKGALTAGSPSAKVYGAMQTMIDMMAWQHHNGRKVKVPD